MTNKKIQRDDKGRFLKGAPSPHKEGRPLKVHEDPTLPAARRRAIFRVADRMIDIKTSNGAERISLFEANALNLARAGAGGDRAAAKAFINLTMQVSEMDLVRRLATRQLIERMDAAEEENAALRSKLKPQHGVVVIPDLPPVTASTDEVYDDGRASFVKPAAGNQEESGEEDGT